MSDFKPFGKAVATQFKKMSKQELFVVDISGDDLYTAYLAAFPEGTNPVYKTKTEHECSCCKNFIRNLGNVVAVEDGVIQTVWQSSDALPYPYDVVATNLNDLVFNRKIVSLFRSSERKYGTEQNVQLLPDGTTHKWNHFYGEVQPKHFTKEVGSVVGAYNTSVAVFERGLKELTKVAVNEVLDLIESNSLYRGTEFKGLVQSFNTALNTYAILNEQSRNSFVWLNAVGALAGFRNTVIGTLVQDLSEGKPLEQAVASYEAKVAPTNYKRPTALITPSMVASAMKTIKELGLEEALPRRFAKISDITVNNVLWADGSTKGKMKAGIEDLLMEATSEQKFKTAAMKSVSMEEFVKSVLPKATGLELYVENTLQSNFMSLTAPVHADSGKLFKWDNDFAWSYDGNITDSIKEKVKKAGGNVTTAKLRISLAWFNKDDLDIHVWEPNNNHIYFGNKEYKLDVDMNISQPVRDPVENVSFTSTKDGLYRVVVHQFNRRETSDNGFTLEVESDGKLHHYSYKKAVSGEVTSLLITVKSGVVTEIKTGEGIIGGSFSQDKWGVKTEKFIKVNTVMLSPNYWDNNKVGNKHWFFVLDKCKTTDFARGIYNEFLNPDLDKHRKVFEVLGEKTKCSPTEDQLSGIGLSSTKQNTVTIKVTTGNQQQVYEVSI